MRYVNSIIALLFAACALFSAVEASWWWSSTFLLGAALALTSLRRDLSVLAVAFLAVASAVTMFIYFAGFFFYAPYERPDWFASTDVRNAFALLAAGFAMKPVLASFTCRMKSGTDTESICAFYRARRAAEAERESRRLGARGRGVAGGGFVSSP